jgi:hypothetical protein
MTAASNTPLAGVTEIALSLPEVEREAYFDHFTFSVRGKKLAYFLNNHHGDGVIGLCVKAGPGENTALIASDPIRFYMPAYIGPRGWVGLRLDIGEVDWSEVRELITDSYLLAAPKSLRNK